MKYWMPLLLVMVTPLVSAGASHVTHLNNARLSAKDYKKPKVLVIATGGTIAGVSVPGDPQHYDPGQLTVDAILKEIPEINSTFNVVGNQLVDASAVTPANPKGYVNVASSFILERHWLSLAAQVNQALAQDYDAVIVTHGTDTLEETGFFLQLTVRSPKPVYMVGSMRPAQGPNPADGPDNLRTAFRLILDADSQDKGVLLISKFQAYPAYDATKIRAFPANISGTDGVPLPSDSLPASFAAPNYGALARVTKAGATIAEWEAEWRSDNPLLKTSALSMKFDVSSATALPLVPIIFQAIGNDSVDLLQSYYFAQKPLVKSFVFVGSGACSLTKDVGTLLTSLAAKEDLMFMRAGHVASNWCQFTQDDSNPNTTGAATLSPMHVKILLQLLQLAIEQNVDLGSLVAKQSGMRDKMRAYLSEHVPYPYHVGSFEPIHDSPKVVSQRVGPE